MHFRDRGEERDTHRESTPLNGVLRRARAHTHRPGVIFKLLGPGYLMYIYDIIIITGLLDFSHTGKKFIYVAVTP